jgi:sugar fermentation stimulation protein A
VEKRHAKFPDAPTLRGKRHLEELIKAKQEGYNSAVLFLIMRNDASIFSPNWEMDPEFSNTLKIARDEGVDVIAYSFEILLKEAYLEIKPLKPVEVKI